MLMHESSAPARRTPEAPPAPLRSELLSALTTGELSRGRLMATSLHGRIPELGDASGHATLYAETQACCAAHVSAILQLLETGDPLDGVTVPDAGREYAVSLVHRRIPLAVLMRAYRVGQNHLWTTFAERLRPVAANEAESVQALEAVAALLFEYVDRVAREVSDVYQEERDQWVRSASAVRADTVRELLDGSPVDVDVASRRLGYELRGRHVGLVLSADPTAGRHPEPGGLERAASRAAVALGARDPLVVPVGRSVLWAWVPAPAEEDADLAARLEARVLEPGLQLAAGRPASGPDGFRITHEEARHAAELHGDLEGHGTGVASYRALELVSLLSADPERARRFVQHELGPLAGDDAASASLRETALAFLDHGGSHQAAAQQLHVHKNTVYTRVRRAERELGVPVAPGRAALHAALTLAVTTPRRVVGERAAEH
ncbi:helix-turn-helix domain-containing protein [Patulibacter sp. NPDC049589]|uniref:PucR family transcriptional regulator n=1 Tax=Patulibacter sp. NPDC049589 TaxID=3154731 RepID=UPI003436FD41